MRAAGPVKRWKTAHSALLVSAPDDLPPPGHPAQIRHALARAGSCARTYVDGSSSESDEVDACERVVNLLHGTARCQVAEVDRGEPRVLEQRDDLRLRVSVVAGDEDHALAASLVWIRAEHFGAERVGGLRHMRARDELGDELARRSPLEIVGGPVVGRVDDDLTVPVEALHGL